MSDLSPCAARSSPSPTRPGWWTSARALAGHGVELLSTGGTSDMLRAAGLAVRDVADLTGFPEMMDGRVKTLHPKVHGGLLALRDKPSHREAMEAHGIVPIDLLIVNLYPFEATVARGASYDDCVENIDIGGPAMIRAAAKNHAFVNVVVDVEDYAPLLAELEAHGGQTTLAFRRRLAQTAYARTAAYDAAVSTWMAGAIGETTPRRRAFAGALRQTLRYGENPHQGPPSIPTVRPAPASPRRRMAGQGAELQQHQRHRRGLRARVGIRARRRPRLRIIKHANPCGVARGATLAEAYARAFDCDRTSAFGGIVALNRPLDLATAEAITEIFTEVVIAPGADDAAKAHFATKKNLRLLTTSGLADPAAPGLAFRQVAGGFLVQDRDAGRITPADLKVVTQRAPTEAELADLLFAWTVAKHVKSNAIVYAKGGATVGIGAGR
jgi:phosphoribosylaminoimidazolecarboxamide formyltransferase / IMP cyclohydrolase